MQALTKVIALMPARAAPPDGRAQGRQTDAPGPWAGGPVVDAAILTTLAQACRDDEPLDLRLRGARRRGHPPPRRAAPPGLARAPLVPRRLRPRPPGLALVPRRPGLGPATTGQRFRPRELPGGDALAFVAGRLPPHPAALRRPRAGRRPGRAVRWAVGRWGDVTDGSATATCLLEMSGRLPAVAGDGARPGRRALRDRVARRAAAPRSRAAWPRRSRPGEDRRGRQRTVGCTCGWRLVVVTGAGAGLGREIALRCGRVGAGVLVGRPRPAAAAATAALVRAAGCGPGRSRPTCCDGDGRALRGRARPRPRRRRRARQQRRRLDPGRAVPGGVARRLVAAPSTSTAGAEAAHPALPRRPRGPPRSHRRPCGRRQRRLQRGARRRSLRLAGVRRREGRPGPLHHQRWPGRRSPRGPASPASCRAGPACRAPSASGPRSTPRRTPHAAARRSIPPVGEVSQTHRRRRPARGPAARPAASSTCVRVRVPLGLAVPRLPLRAAARRASRPRRRRAAARQLRPGAARGRDRTVGSGSGSARPGATSTPSDSTAPAPPSREQPPASTGASGIADIEANWLNDWHPPEQVARGDRDPVGADARVAGRVEQQHDGRAPRPPPPGCSTAPSAPAAAGSSRRSTMVSRPVANRSMIHGATTAPRMPAAPAAVSTSPRCTGSTPSCDQAQHGHEEQRVDDQVGQRRPAPAACGRTGRPSTNRGSRPQVVAHPRAVAPSCARRGEVGADPAEQHPRDGVASRRRRRTAATGRRRTARRRAGRRAGRPRAGGPGSATARSSGPRSATTVRTAEVSAGAKSPGARRR